MSGQNDPYRTADYRKMSGKGLLSCLEQGDEMSIGEVYRRYRDILNRHALRMTKDESLAADALQDVFISLLDKCRNGFSPSHSLEGYLYTALRNRILNLIAAEKVRSNYLSTLADYAGRYTATTDHRVRERELAEQIEREISFLPDRMREIFELHRNDHLTYQEIADQLGLSDKTVKKQVSNALAILRHKLHWIVFLLFFGRL